MAVVVSEAYQSEQQMFDAIKDVVHDVGEMESRECLGFQQSRLVLCDGRTISPITARKSVDWMIRVKQAEKDGVYDGADGTYQGQLMWLAILAAALA